MTPSRETHQLFMPLRKILVLTLLCLLFRVPSAPASDADQQFWNTYYGEKSLTRNLKFSAEEEFRVGRDISRLTYSHTDFGLIYTAASWLELGINYRLIRAWKVVLWEYEHQPYFSATFKKTWDHFEISNRSRVEDRILTHTKDFWRYTNQTKLQYFFHVHGLQVGPYISHEYFVDFDQTIFNFVRIAAGFEIQLSKNVTSEIYYLRQDQNSRGTEPKANVIGLRINFLF